MPSESTENLFSGLGQQLTGLKCLLHRLENHRTHTSFTLRTHEKYQEEMETELLFHTGKKTKDLLIKLATETKQYM